jgi:hypothetical protein
VNVTIPEPGGPLLCGQILTGQGICGQPRAADAWTSYALDLIDGNAEVLVTAPVDAPVTVEITGSLDLPADTADLTSEKSVAVVVTDTGYLDLLLDTATTHLDVIIRESAIDELLCGPTVICGQWVCGYVFSGQRWSKYTLDLVTDLNAITVTRNPSILVEIDQPLELATAPADVHFGVTLVAEDASTALELDGGEGIVNPVLIPFDCFDLDLALVTCTPLDLAVLACASSDPTAITVTQLDLTPATPVEIDLEALVCEEA